MSGELATVEYLAISYQIDKEYLTSTPPPYVLFEREAELVTQANKIHHVPRAQATQCQEPISPSPRICAHRAPGSEVGIRDSKSHVILW